MYMIDQLREYGPQKYYIDLFFYLQYNQQNYMNLTINQPKNHLRQVQNHYQQNKTPSTPVNHNVNNYNTHQRQTLSNPALLFMQCCIAKNHQNDNSRDFQLIQDINSPHRLSALEAQRQTARRKTKLQVSLKKEKNKSQTPKRYHILQSSRNKSQSKKMKTQANVVHGVRIINLHCNNSNKLKTEPKKEQLLQFNYMKEESIKPSTNIGSNYHSPKKALQNPNKKMKLSLSGSFKSQIEFGNKRPTENSFKNRIGQEGYNKIDSNEVLVEQSFMTAKLVNIYGQMSHHDSYYQHHSNIVYYNKLMNNDQAWKSPDPYQEQEVYLNYSQDSYHEPYITEFTKFPAETSINKQLKEVNSAREIEEQIEQDMHKSKAKDRRRIGEYAKTIKTFNESESKSIEEIQSVVLYKATTNNNNSMMQNMCMPVNRGSIKQYKNSSAQNFCRPYGSLRYSQQSESANLINGQKFVGLTNYPIEQNSVDSQKEERYEY